MQTAQSRYPGWLIGLVTALCSVFLVFAFIPSAQRLHAVAYLTNNAIEGVKSDVVSVYWAALATVFMAEIGQVLFSLAAATIATERLRIRRLTLPDGLTVASYICLAIALSGNAIALGDAATKNAIQFLETYAPPVLVLITATILKAQLLNAVQARHEAQTQYNAALERWQLATTSADSDPAWGRTLANCLRDALRDANKGKKAVLRALTTQDWLSLVHRERKTEEWWDAAQTLPTGSTGAGGEAVSAETQRDGDTFIKVCPECQKRFEGATLRSATNGLVAHLKRHRNAEKKASVNGTHTPEERIEA